MSVLDNLTQKLGPLPVWAWGAGAGGLLILYRIRSKQEGETVEEQPLKMEVIPPTNLSFPPEHIPLDYARVLPSGEEQQITGEPGFVRDLVEFINPPIPVVPPVPQPAPQPPPPPMPIPPARPPWTPPIIIRVPTPPAPPIPIPRPDPGPTIAPIIRYRGHKSFVHGGNIATMQTISLEDTDPDRLMARVRAIQIPPGAQELGVHGPFRI